LSQAVTWAPSLCDATAVHGGYSVATSTSSGWAPSADRVLDLRRRLAAVRRMGTMAEISSLTNCDRVDWEVLARSFKAFFKAEVRADSFEQTWRRLLDGEEIRGISGGCGPDEPRPTSELPRRVMQWKASRRTG
jgi:hypothetical protein